MDVFKTRVFITIKLQRMEIYMTAKYFEDF